MTTGSSKARPNPRLNITTKSRKASTVRSGSAPRPRAKVYRKGKVNGRTTRRDIRTPATKRITTGAVRRKMSRRSFGLSPGATKRQNSTVITGDVKMTARNIATLSWMTTASGALVTMILALPWTRDSFRTWKSCAGIVSFCWRVGRGSQTVVPPRSTGWKLNVSVMMNATRNAMTTRFSRARSSSRCSKKVIRRSSGGSSSFKADATAARRGKRAYGLWTFPPGCSERIAVFRPWVRGIAVPADLPVAEFLRFRERDRADPLRDFPGVPLRDDQAQGASVLEGQRLPVPLVRQEDVVVIQDGGRVGRRVSVAATERRVATRRLDLGAIREFADRHADPLVLERRPARDAVKVRHDGHPREGEQLVVRQAQGPRDFAVHPQVPLLRIEARHDSEIEPGPLPDLALPGRKLPVRRHRHLIGPPAYKWLCPHSTRIARAAGRSPRAWDFH